jgi:hypothetical protein
MDTIIPKAKLLVGIRLLTVEPIITALLAYFMHRVKTMVFLLGKLHVIDGVVQPAIHMPLVLVLAWHPTPLMSIILASINQAALLFVA